MKSATRHLTSVGAARWERLPWFIRRRAAELELIRRSPRRLAARMACLDYGRLPRQYHGAEIHTTDPKAPIWQFWAAGGASAPPLVQRCLESVANHSEGHPVRVLDADTYHDYIRLPSRIEGLREQIGWAHISDILRVALLADHGGIWIDATARLSGPIPTAIATEPFFAFTRPEDPFLISSWYMASSAGHPVMRALTTMLGAYWTDQDGLIDYFLLHLLFEAAVTINASLRALWIATPVLSFGPPHVVQSMMAEQFDEARLQRALTGSWIHKLTWKLPGGLDQSGTVAEWLGAH